MQLLQSNNLVFSYPSSQEPLIDSLSLAFDRGWTGVVGANGSGKTTLLRLVAGELTPTAGVLTGPDDRVYCNQGVERIPEHFDDFLNAWDERAMELIRVLHIEYEWLFRWDTLSYGERKRAQLASALWRAPTVLALDEPTNHLDEVSRTLVGDALERWDDIGLVVSHDRELLDRLCSRTLFLAGGRAVMRPGGVTLGLSEERREQIESERVRAQALREERRLKREAQRRTEVESRASRRLSKRNLDRHDKDRRSRIDGARLAGKDRRGSDAARGMRERAREAGDKRVALGRSQGTFAGSEEAVSITAQPSRSDVLVELSAGILSAGGASSDASSHGNAFELEVPTLTVRPTDRIAICGPNGSGKSTLLDAIASRLRGEGREIFHMRQELSTPDLVSVREQLDSLDKVQRGQVLAMVTRLGSDPERILATTVTSPGEARKLALSFASLRSPQALLLDEPTNHLDLPAIVALEHALAEYNGCLLLSSHDQRFIEHLTVRRWRVEILDTDGAARRGKVRELPIRTIRS